MPVIAWHIHPQTMIRLDKSFRMHQHQSPFQICDKNKARRIAIDKENMNLQIISMILLLHSRIKDLHRIVYDLDDMLVYPEPSPYDDDEEVDPVGCTQDIHEIGASMDNLQNLENSITLDMYYLVYLVFRINMEQGSKKRYTVALYRLYAAYKNVIEHRSYTLQEYSKLFNLDLDHRSIMASNILCNIKNNYDAFMTCFEAEIYNLLNSF